MKKLLIALLLTAGLAGCASFDSTPDAVPTTVKIKYIVTTIPDELLTIPPPTYKIDPKTATDKDASIWMSDSEARYLEIEKRFKAIKEYQANKLKSLKIPKEDIINN